MYKLAAADTTVFCCNFTGNVAFSRFAVKTNIEGSASCMEMHVNFPYAANQTIKKF